MTKPEGFKTARNKVLKALAEGTYLHETRGNIDVKNLLLTGVITAEELAAIILRCTGAHHEAVPHHQVRGIHVHILKRDGWYIKFYFLNPNTIFISVHRQE
jgi:hypothetical protein